ncbi:MAG: hypothetical protein AB8H80_09865 [Planctomycetota bacterium]
MEFLSIFAASGPTTNVQFTVNIAASVITGSTATASIDITEVQSQRPAVHARP